MSYYNKPHTKHPLPRRDEVKIKNCFITCFFHLKKIKGTPWQSSGLCTLTTKVWGSIPVRGKRKEKKKYKEICYQVMKRHEGNLNTYY